MDAWPNLSRRRNSYAFNSRKRLGRNNLYVAAEQGKLVYVSLLLALGKNPNHTDTYGITPLQIAAWKDRCKVVDKLSKHQCDLNLKDRNRHTALVKSVWRGCQKCVQCLLQSGADHSVLDRNECTPLMLACQMGYSDIVRLLLERGANTELKNVHGETALHISTIFGKLDCFECLAAHGADLESRTTDECTPFFIASGLRQTNATFKILKYLIARNVDVRMKGCDFDVLDGKPITALELAIRIHSFFIGDLLIKGGCSLDVLHRWFSAKRLPQSLLDHRDWLKHFEYHAQNPRSLWDLSRFRIRELIRGKGTLNDLPLPDAIIFHLSLPEVENYTIDANRSGARFVYAQIE